MTETSLKRPKYRDVVAAADRLKGYAVRTPLIENHMISKLVGGRVFLKPEVLQRTGSFKFRGAFNKLVQLSPDQRAKGVVAFSSGNHAQGVAAAAQILGITATIVMPEDAPVMKTSNTRGYGARIVTFNRFKDDREALARQISEETGATLVPSFDDPDIISGQGTAGLEVCEDLDALGIEADQFIAPIGGGGLMSGCSLCFKEHFPQTKLYCVEPEGYDDHARSLVSGVREVADITRASLCDALMAPMPGSLTFSINQKNLDGGFWVTDDEVRQAVRCAHDGAKLVVEPGGAVGLAAILSGKVDAKDKTTVVLLSGGNMDAKLTAEILGATTPLS